MHPEIAAALSEFGAIGVRDHPRLRSTLARQHQQGALLRPFKGVYTQVDPSQMATLAAAGIWSGPTGVIHDASAVAFWSLAPAPGQIHLTHPTLTSRGDVVVSRRLVPDRFVVDHGGIRVASAAFACVEVAAMDDGRAICDALRLGRANQHSVADALAALAGSRHQVMRRIAVTATARGPWSYAELRLHRLLLGAGITDWVANQAIDVGGVRVVPDIRFRRQPLILEFDGRITHSSTAEFLNDRERQNLLESAGFHVLRFGWEHLDEPQYVAGVIQRTQRRIARKGE